MAKTERIEVHPENCVGCLTCQLACSFTHTDRFNPLSARIKVEWYPDGSKISFTDQCTDCGTCAEYCFYGALEKIEGEK
ncbi:MAG: 4Fe-4S binding protein [Candidatus Lokiarchaeia archaeon]